MINKKKPNSLRICKDSLEVPLVLWERCFKLGVKNKE